MARKIRAKLIMELREQGLSRRTIAKTRRMSMESVCDVFGIAAERGIGWDDVKDMSDDDVYRLFYPDRHVRESVFEEPDRDYVHKEMAKVGVNLRLLHDEYKEECRRTGKAAMGYTRFCGDYGDRTVADNLTKRIERKAGQSCEVDWSGPTIGKGPVGPIAGEASKVYLFVGVLPFSQKAYFEPTLDMGERAWLRCHVHMYEFWGGVPERTVCDNLKIGVVEHPREGEIALDDAYEALGEHCMTAIMPAQVRKPKQKASAEGTVRDAATWAIAQLRNRAFTSFDEVVTAVRERNAAYNAHPFQKRGAAATRRSPRQRRRRSSRCPTPTTTSPNGFATARSTSTSTSCTPRTAILRPTATPGARSICGSASPPCQSTMPATASPHTGCRRRTFATDTRPTSRTCPRPSSSPSGTTCA